jgi:DNA-binding XRE family transcriptional regulator
MSHRVAVDSETVFNSLIVDSRRNGSRAEESAHCRTANRSGAAEIVRTAFGQVLREQRKLRGLTQEALALSASVNPKFYGEIERGFRQPTLTTLCKLACALDIAPHILIERMEKMLRLDAADA